ncbi:MAG: RlmE family RNA methyltransferase [Holosporales bacterium]|jgi:23S rRNA (uridine2552-2'-O)-methyltransferase|nr:RlmE family RNA methyltransferase [Holosporales bacterium]
MSISLNSKKKRTPSSRKWLLRQLNDPYVLKSKKEGYRSRAAFKLIDIDNKFKILKTRQVVIDLGCAPGGWLQVVKQRVKGGIIIGVDLQEFESISGIRSIIGDFTEKETINNIIEVLQGKKADVVLSDMASSACGISSVDHTRIMFLVKCVLNFCDMVLEKDGCMVAKVLRGGTENTLLAEMKKKFKKVSHFKPPSSRSDSAEIYVVAIGYNPTIKNCESKLPGNFQEIGNN